MLKKYFIMAITAIFALVACSEKFDEPGIQPAGSDNVHTLSVGIEAGTYTPAEGGTKASMEAVIRVNWTANDEVSVVNATTKKILGGCLKATDSGVSVTFEGTVTGTINQNDKLYYIYPRLNNTEEIAFAAAGYDQKLSGQKYDATKPNEVCFYGYAEDVAGTATISKKIQFNLVTSYAHLNMSNLPAKGASLTSIDISNVNEGFTWKLSSEKTLSAEPYAGNNGISVTCTNYNITQAGNAVVRFAIPASAATGSESRVVTVNKAYTNDKYIKDQLIPSAYYNQLYTSWTNENVNVNSAAGDKTEVTIDNLGSTETAEGILPVSGESSSAFAADKPTEISLGGLGTITFNQQASAAIKTNTQNAQSTNVFFKVEDVTETKPVQNANLVYEITMKTVDGNGTEVFSKNNAGTGSEATVVIELGQSVQSVESVSLVDENGNPITGDAVKGFNFDPNTGRLTFTVVHFSKYAIKYTTKAEPESGYVAQIGERNYETLSSAVAAAQNGNTIKLLCDCMDAEGIIVPEGKNFTLDFGGHTYKVTKDLAGSTGTKNQCFQLLKGSTLVFQNGTITTSCAKLGINSYSDLIVKDVTIDMSQTSATGQVACLETCNGNISLQGNTNLKTKNDQIAVLALYWPNGGYGDINVELNTTGEVRGLMAYGSYQVLDPSTVAQHSHVAIKNGKYDVTFDMDNLENYDFKIYGGVFKTSPATEYLAPNHEVVTNTDSETSASYTYKVQQKPYVAQIGSTKYFSLAEAVAAVPANTQTTITMVNDFATTEKVTITAAQNIVLELNGKKISYTTDGYGSFIENRGQLKIKDSGSNGIITAKFSAPNWSDGCYTINNAGTYENASKLVIESGTIENTSPASGLAWPISNGVWGTYADLVINGGTIHSTNYVPVREYLQYGGKKTIIINGGKFISDNSRAIAVQVSDATIQDTGSSVTINGGEFTCNGSGILYIDLHAANVDMTGFAMTVNGGKFSNSNTSVPVLVYDNEGNSQTSAVLLSKILKGGIYSKEPAPELISFGYHIEANADTQTKSAYPWSVAANPAANAEVSISKPGQTTVYSTLADFRDATNAGNTFAGYTVTLLKDIDLNNEEWTPISNYAYGAGSDKLFAGTFDGDNHIISNLKIASCNQDALGNTENVARGFFGQVATCTIKNLKFSNANVSSDAGINAIVASLHTESTGKLIMDNVQVLSGSVSCSNENAGGLVAFCTGWSEFTNCVNHASVTGYGVGGIVGILRDNAGINTCVISDCINYGAITNTVGGGDGAGGIVSKIQDYGTISGCKNYGEIKGTVGNVYAAGIIGIANCGNSKPINITDCVNYASITSDAGDYGRAGGIVAKWSGSYTISHCINSGNITGYQGAGGIVGWSGDSWGLIVKYSYNSGSVTTSHGNSGGIDQGEANQTISYSLNSGSVSCAEGKKAEQISNSSSTISSCYYYDGDTLKDKDGTEVNDVDAALASLNTGLSTPFWGKDGNTIKPIAIINK